MKKLAHRATAFAFMLAGLWIWHATAQSDTATPTQYAWWCYVTDCGWYDYIDVDMVSPTEGWAISQASRLGSSIWHWSDGHWANSQTFADMALVDVDMSSPSEGWAVGKSDLVHWDGNTWERYPAAINNIIDVASVSPSDAWVLGNGGCAITCWNAEIWHWNGREWVESANPSVHSPSDLSMVTKDDGWAVTQGGEYLHWNGQQWSIWSPKTGISLELVDMADLDEGWAVSHDGRYFHWNGKIWSESLPKPSFSAQAIDSVREGDLWAVGEGVMHWNGVAWITLDTDVQVPLLGISMHDDTSGLIVGAKGARLSWSTGVLAGPGVVTPPGTYVAVSVIDEYNAWAAGPSGILHWNGSTWANASLPVGLRIWPYLHDIDMLSTNEGWAVGSGGTILHWDGQQWSRVDSSSGDELLSIDVLSAQSVWVVGKTQILRWNGASWLDTTPAGLTQEMSDIDMVSDSVGWAVGQRSMVLHWDGISWNNWTFLDQGDSALTFSAVDALTAIDVWIVTEGGAMFHWNGTEWKWQHPQANPGNCFDIKMVSREEGWITCEFALLKWTNNAPMDNRFFWVPSLPLGYPDSGLPPAKDSAPHPDHFLAVDVTSNHQGWLISADSGFFHMAPLVRLSLPQIRKGR